MDEGEPLQALTPRTQDDHRGSGEPSVSTPSVSKKSGRGGMPPTKPMATIGSRENQVHRHTQSQMESTGIQDHRGPKGLSATSHSVQDMPCRGPPRIQRTEHIDALSLEKSGRGGTPPTMPMPQNPWRPSAVARTRCIGTPSLKWKAQAYRTTEGPKD